jgi:hypothetical protein
MAGYGVPHDQIACLVRDGIHHETLYKCMAWANARIEAGAAKATIQKARPHEPAKTVLVFTQENRK